jgi:hypothetical protein
MPTSARTVSNDAVNWPARSQRRNRNGGNAIVKIYHQVADLLGGPPSVGIGGRAQQVHGSVAHLTQRTTRRPA